MKVLMLSIITAAVLSILSGGEEIGTQADTVANTHDAQRVSTLR